MVYRSWQCCAPLFQASGPVTLLISDPSTGRTIAGTGSNNKTTWKGACIEIDSRLAETGLYKGGCSVDGWMKGCTRAGRLMRFARPKGVLLSISVPLQR